MTILQTAVVRHLFIFFLFARMPGIAGVDDLALTGSQ